MRANACAMALLLVLAGCGGNPGRPDDPDLVSVTITNVPPGFLFLGETYTFAMSARMSNGTTVTTGGTWGSDAPAVATVNSVSGQVQILGLGDATVYVDYQGVRGIQPIQSTVRYAGQMEGVSRIRRCVDTGDWALVDTCAEFPNGSAGTFEGTFTQSGRSVTAVMSLGGGETSNPVTATVSDAGELRFDTSHAFEGLTARVRWSLQPSGLTQIRGNHTIRFQAAGVSGYVEITADIDPFGISQAVPGGAAGAADSLERRLERALERARR